MTTMIDAWARVTVARRRLFLAVNRCDTCRLEVEGARHGRWCAVVMFRRIRRRLEVVFGPDVYEGWTDTWNLGGLQFSGELIRELTRAENLPGPWFRIVSRDGGAVTLENPGDFGEARVGCVKCGTRVRLLAPRGCVVSRVAWCPDCSMANILEPATAEVLVQ